MRTQKHGGASPKLSRVVQSACVGAVDLGEIGSCSAAEHNSRHDCWGFWISCAGERLADASHETAPIPKLGNGRRGISASRIRFCGRESAPSLVGPQLRSIFSRWTRRTALMAGMAGRGCVVALLYAPGEVVMRVKYTSTVFRAIGFAIENAAARPCGSRAMPS